MTAYTYEHKYCSAQAFAKRFKGATRERAEKDTFWNEFFAIFKLDRYKTATTEYAVRHRKGCTKFADVFWAGRLLCEHKSAGKDPEAAYHQALEYVEEIRRHNAPDVPRYISVSDFANIELHDLQEQTCIAFPLQDLPDQIKLRNFDFMDGIGQALKAAEEQANIEAATAAGNLYDAFRKDGNYPEHDLKQFIIRLLFCFFVDDTLTFTKDQFAAYLAKYTRADGEDLSGTLNRIFSVLNTPPDRRPGGMNTELKDFPYVNGKLFADSLCEFYFDAALRELLFECSYRDWAQISPEIFGSLFQSVMNSVERRELGAHYTGEANILKVINGLFMEDLRERFHAAQKLPKAKRRDAMQALHQHTGSLQFLDPACGCGNFLVVAYRELRKLEDDIIGELFAENQLLDISTMQQRHIGQFHGIEIDEYPAQIAKVAMWLTDHQCNLRTDWLQADYIFGNPPFIGYQWRSVEQQDDCAALFPKDGKFGKMDYVACWYVKAARIMLKQLQVQTAFVSTNSICQGEQAGVLWACDAPVRLMAEFDKYPELRARTEGVKALRLKSPTASVLEFADRPYLFTQNRQPSRTFLTVPEVSSERRHYIPMDFMGADNVPINLIYTVADIDEYTFGVLISEMHMAWVRTVTGRLKSDYRYTPNVYHSFLFPQADTAQKEVVKQLAQAVLDARQNERKKDPEATLAVLYNSDTIPKSLRDAHKKLDAAVDKLCRKEKFINEVERMGYLFDLYQQLAAPIDVPA